MYTCITATAIKTENVFHHPQNFPCAWPGLFPSQHRPQATIDLLSVPIARLVSSRVSYTCSTHVVCKHLDWFLSLRVVFFFEISPVFISFGCWVLFVFLFLSCKSSYYILDICSFVKYMHSKYFPPSCGLPFLLKNSVYWRAEL